MDKPTIKLTGVQPDYVHGRYVRFKVPKGTKLIIDAPVTKEKTVKQRKRPKAMLK